MRYRASGFSVTMAALAGIALLSMAAVGCFPGTPAAAPDPSAPAAAPTPQAARAAPAATVQAEPTLVTPTLSPTPATPTRQPARPAPVAQAPVSAEPTVEATTETSRLANAAFDDIDALEETTFAYLKEMAEGVGVRTSGTELERQAAEYLVRRLEDLGYEPMVQEFSWDSPDATLTINISDLENVDANTLSGTGNGEASAPLVFVGLAKPEDIPSVGLEGRIALIERGEITFGAKVSQVHQAGAAAAIVFNNVQGPFRGSLGGRSQIPAVSISQADGRRLRDLMGEGTEIEGTVSVADNANPSRNIIAELPGAEEGVVVVGAHFDTVPDSIGASDNSSGMGVLLAVAEWAIDKSFPFTLRFIAFGSEETGLHGSEHYVDELTKEELEEIYVMINVDSVGSGSRLRVSGDRWLTNHLRETAEAQGIDLSVSRGGRGGSDHANFRNAWVPVVFFLSNDLSRINSPADTMEHINPALLGQSTGLIMDLLENLHLLPGFGL